MKEKDNLSDLVSIIQNNKPTQARTGDQKITASDGTVVTLHTTQSITKSQD